VDAELLTGIYERVRDCEFRPGTDHVSQVIRIEQMIIGKKPVMLDCCVDETVALHSVVVVVSVLHVLAVFFHIIIIIFVPLVVKNPGVKNKKE